MTLVGDKNETFDDQQKAYEKAQEVLRAFPNVKGFQGLRLDRRRRHRARDRGARARGQDLRASGPRCRRSPGSIWRPGPSTASGSGIPSLAGYAMNKLATMVMNGEEVTDGMDLGLEGYEKVKLDGKVIYGQAWVNVNKDNMADYPF